MEAGPQSSLTVDGIAPTLIPLFGLVTSIHMLFTISRIRILRISRLGHILCLKQNQLQYCDSIYEYLCTSILEEE